MIPGGGDPRWGICTTARAPRDQMLAFLAHHLELGAARIWLHCDDPAQAAALPPLPRVTVIACNADHWQGFAQGRPGRHQTRQTANMRRIHAAAPLPWIAHIDVDEFMMADAPVADLLAAAPADAPFLRMAPWEALHAPGLPDDIFTARHFRAAMVGPDHAAARAQAFGPLAPVLPKGVLSHAAGKCFFRTGLPGLQPRLHGAFRDDQRLPSGTAHPGLALLHFHASDPAQWLSALPFRLSRGAYQFNPPLQAHLMALDGAGQAGFFEAVQMASPAMLADLRALGLLRCETLNLRAKVARMLQESPVP